MSENSLAMMPWFPRDFIAATRAMRIAERCAYRELLDFQWELGVLPADECRLARLIGFTDAEFADAWPGIQHKFITVEGGIANKRLEEHRVKALQQRDMKRKGAAIVNAKRSAERSAERSAQRPAEHISERNGQRVASATPPSPSPSPSPSVKDKKPSSLRSEVKENGQENPGSPKAPPTREPTATRLPKDFALSTEMRDYAASEQLDAERTFAQFKDFWAAASGAKARKHDWLATWRTWCRNQNDRNGNGRVMQGPRPTRYEQLFGKEDVVIEEPV